MSKYKALNIFKTQSILTNKTPNDMKKLILLAAVLVSAAAANAKVWRVNPNEAARADFLSVTDACNAAKVTRGDTLYCEPGSYQGTQTISKPQLTLLGPGWEIPTNFGSTSTIAMASFTGVLEVATDSTYIAGIWASKILLPSHVGINHLTIERCMFGQIYTNSSYEAYNRTLKNLTIRNNFISSKLYDGDDPISLIYFGSILNVSIENNIIVNYNENTDPYYNCTAAIVLKAGNVLNTTGLIAHNTIITRNNTINSYDSYAIEAYYTTIRDNIIINRITTDNLNESVLLQYDKMSTCEFYNNVLSITAENVTADFQNYFPNNSYIGATLANTFTRTIEGGAAETYFRLKEGSVAAAKAYQGEDCGAYAGAYPFIVNGRPRGVPYIYDVNAPNYPENDVLNISFKVKANNQ